MSLPYGGVREYATAAIRELIKLGSRHRFSVYYSDANLVGANPGAHEYYLPAPHKFLWDHWLLPNRLHAAQPDVVWFPHNVSSLGLRLPTVVSVMDMLYFRLPGFPYREYAWPDTLYMRAFMPRSLRRARRVMAISDWTAGDINHVTGVPRDRITTIHLAPGAGFQPVPEVARSAARAKYGLAAPFFFYAGILSPRKNIRLLVEAFGQIHTDVPHDLVLTGGAGYLETPLEDLIEHYGLDGRVRRLGLVPRDDLMALYGAAEAFVFPSLYEGFGIPPLEAFACGCPVICSAATSLGEVAGDAALMFNPHRAEELAAHMRLVATDAATRGRLIKAGFEQVKRFSYTRAANELLTLIEEAAV
jgi:glycosyltransferase involved in cell wall biosynthesis